MNPPVPPTGASGAFASPPFASSAFASLVTRADSRASTTRMSPTLSRITPAAASIIMYGPSGTKSNPAILAPNIAPRAGAPLVWVGSTLLVLGLYMVFFFPHRRVWVRVRKTSGGSEILCASTMKRDVAFEPQFNQLVTDIQLAGSPVEHHEKVGQNDA